MPTHHQPWLANVNGDPLAWLLEPDAANPAIRYFALRDLLARPPDDPQVIAARAAIMSSGTVPAILAAQHPDGYWERPDFGYGKYRGTHWQIILLGEMGADPADERVRLGCEYLLTHSIASTGAFAYNRNPVPSGVVPCLNGNLLQAVIRLGCLDDPRVQRALDWQARAVTGDGVAYFKSGTSGPDFACAVNEGQPCGWGATKALKALAEVSPQGRTPAMERAIEQGVAFLLRYDLARADYPYTGNISATWFKLGFPLSYWSDVLETLGVLVALGCGGDERLTDAYHWLLGKQDAEGRWKLENSLNGKMWVDIEQKGRPSKWVTLRALRVVKGMETAIAAAAI